jgi:hypothetical protein
MWLINAMSLLAFQLVHKSRILHQNLVIDITGLSRCIIPLQKYSVVYGRGIACDRWDQVAAARASRNLDSVSEPYIGDDFPQTG